MTQRNRKRNSRRSLKLRRQTILPALLIGGTLLFLALMIYGAVRPQPGEAVSDLGNLHIAYPETAEYNSSPPTSGPHYTQIAAWGIHDEPIPNELQVHNLEDGGVMVQYSCVEGCDTLVTALERVVSKYDRGVILAPYPDLESTIALTAWGRIDRLEEFDEKRIERFIEAYRGIDHHR